MNYQEIAISSKNRSYEENLNLIIARKAECNHIIELREKHISWLQENPISLEKVNLLKKEEWALGYNFYGYGMNFSKLLDALNYWEDFYSPYDETDDLERLEKSLKFDNANEFIVKVIENKPIMYVVEKVTKSYVNKESDERENIFVGIKTRWFDANQVLHEAIFSTKDLIHV